MSFVKTHGILAALRVRVLSGGGVGSSAGGIVAIASSAAVILESLCGCVIQDLVEESGSVPSGTREPETRPA